MANYITKEGMSRLKKRMQQLIEERPSIIKQVVEAREMGDLSENAEYHAARERQRELENEYNRIKKKVETLQVINTANIPKDAVRFGARVTLRSQATMKTQKIHLVGADEVFESDDEFERTSILSPIGKAAIGKKIGEIFNVVAPIGNKKYEIIEIK